MTFPSLPDNLRLYAIGDIHGRLDLLQQLVEQIIDDARSCNAAVKAIFLGDYIDRGLHSSGVIDALIAMQDEETFFLAGNHEQVMRDIISGDNSLLQDWLRFGGRETLLSYGIKPPVMMDEVSLNTLMRDLTEKVPPAHQVFLRHLPTSISFGDYFFCHAGVRPGITLAHQSQRDLAWIRHEFMVHTEPFEKIIVHGHTICPEVEFKPNRINIDTGAYATGCLTALGLEGTRQWLLQTK